MTSTISHQVAVAGGGNAGISLAARLRRAGLTDIGTIEPAESHYYQPLWTLVGGGCAPAAESQRTEASMPQGVGWIKDRAEQVDPTHKPAPSIPLIDTAHERRDMWYLKHRELPAMYLNLILTSKVIGGPC